MSIPGAGNPLLLGGAGGYKIERSLRFNSADSAYLSRTPASAGNRKTWTWAGWVKVSDLGGSDQTLFSGGTTSSATGASAVFFRSNRLCYSSATADILQTAALFRDPSAWYHILVAFDSTQSTATSRLLFYVNGAEVTAYSTDQRAANIAQNTDYGINQAQAHEIGRMAVFATKYFSGYLTDIHFIDGQALTPTSFGEFDTNGIWQPKAYTGSYGTNGFHLPFSDNSTAAALGTDTSGNGNNWTPNNLIAGPVFTSNSWSGFFNGATATRLTLPSNSAFAFGTGAYTVEGWVFAKGYASVQGSIFDSGNANGAFDLYVTSTGAVGMGIYGTGTVVDSAAGAIPLNRWVHVAAVRTSTSTNGFIIYVDGTAVATSTDSSNWTVTTTPSIGGINTAGYSFNGYISNLRVVKGSAVYTSAFTPATSPLTAISGTSLLTLQDSTFKDNSSNVFTVTSNGALISVDSPFEEFSDTDSFVDSPTNYGTDTGAGGEVRGNYCTLNPLIRGASTTLSNGNLNVDFSNWNSSFGTVLIPTSGKWFFEVIPATTASLIGIARATENLSTAAATYFSNPITSYSYYATGDKALGPGNVQTTYGAAFTSSDVVGVAFDADAGTIVFYKNGVSQGTAFTGITGQYVPAIASLASGFSVNFGQRPFAYTAPSGFKALCTTNLPEPTIADGTTVMDVALYTGNGSTQTISGLGFSPDLVWLKGRTNIGNHGLYDTVRGVSKQLVSNDTAAETTNPGVFAFNSDGFDVGPAFSQSSNAWVAWTWDAGSSTVTNTAGTITSQVRANPSAGFSVVTYTGNGITGATVGHGLGVAPGMIILKRRDAASTNWYVYHSTIGATGAVTLNLTAGTTTSGNFWNNTAPTSSVVTISANAGTEVNGNGGLYLLYCFAPVAGYSAFGKYTGNGSADGPFVYTGFRPRWIMVKRSDSTGSWHVHDTQRDPTNPNGLSLYPDWDGAELGSDTSNVFDFLSNGFKLRINAAALNANAGTYIWAAFAEHPFSLARAR